MKKYLIVAQDLDETAPGAVFKALIRSLSRHAEITVVCPNWDVNYSWDGIARVQLPHYHAHSWKTIRRRYRLFGTNFADGSWLRKAFPLALKAVKGTEFDCVISFTAMCQFTAITLGRKLAAELGAPWYIYSVDGIPSPKEWMEGELDIHNRMARQLDRDCRGARLFFSSNPFMMEYQKGILKHFDGQWGFLYTPHPQTHATPKLAHEGVRFLYTGNLYGLRRVDGLVEAFRRFRTVHPGARMTFVGAINPKVFSFCQDLVEDGSIVVKPFCKDLAPFLEEADILVDIGSHLPGDVFLSSKIISYLPQERPILAITGNPSPARSVFKDCSGVFHASNQADEILSAMEACVNALPQETFPRERFIALFDADNVARILYENTQA